MILIRFCFLYLITKNYPAYIDYSLTEMLIFKALKTMRLLSLKINNNEHKLKTNPCGIDPLWM